MSAKNPIIAITGSSIVGHIQYSYVFENISDIKVTVGEWVKKIQYDYSDVTFQDYQGPLQLAKVNYEKESYIKYNYQNTSFQEIYDVLKKSIITDILLI